MWSLNRTTIYADEGERFRKQNFNRRISFVATNDKFFLDKCTGGRMGSHWLAEHKVTQVSSSLTSSTYQVDAHHVNNGFSADAPFDGVTYTVESSDDATSRS